MKNCYVQQSSCIYHFMGACEDLLASGVEIESCEVLGVSGGTPVSESGGACSHVGKGREPCKWLQEVLLENAGRKECVQDCKWKNTSPRGVSWERNDLTLRV